MPTVFSQPAQQPKKPGPPTLSTPQAGSSSGPLDLSNMPSNKSQAAVSGPGAATPVQSSKTQAASQGTTVPVSGVAPVTMTPSQDVLNNQMYQDMMSQHEGTLAGSMELAQRGGAAEQRRAAEMSAGMGAGAGGGTFASGMAQANLAGRGLALSAQQEHATRGLELRMSYLQMQMQNAEAAKDRDLQERLQTMINATALEIEGYQSGSVPPPVEDTAGDGTSTWGDINDARTGHTGTSAGRGAAIEAVTGGGGLGATYAAGRSLYNRVL